MSTTETSPVARAVRAFRRAGGTLRTSEALRAGVHPSTFYRMRDEGLLVRLARGLYRLAELEPLSQHDLVVVTRRVPKAVVCLVSALSLHGVTTQIPTAVDVALPRGHTRPKLDHPPLRPHWFSGALFSGGVEEIEVDDARVRVYSVEKSLVDCFRLRDQVGMEVFLEALRLYRARKPLRVDLLLEFARVGRVEGKLTPYVEAVL